MLANGRLSRQVSSPNQMGDKSSFIASNRARSREGHAAAPMGIKDDDQRWIQIQQKTFTNWVNEQLKAVGKRVEDLQVDFQDGLNLIALIEVLQGRRIGKAFQNPVNQHQMLENVQLALNAMMEDNIKLVNIGNQDIVEGNLKLILGLVWTLILRYQIGKTNLPPRKLMLAWLQAVLHDMKIKNFTRDWNDGIALSGLLEYCRPGLFPNWRNLDPHNKVDNLRRAMEVANREFGIPMLISPEDLASSDLDELSGMTYLSYFMNSPDSPGYKATLRWVRSQIPEENVENFTMDWNDGRVVGSLVKSLGGTVAGYTTQAYDRYNWEDNLQRGFKGGRELGVEPILTPKQMAEAVDEHLGIMAYAAWFQWVNPLPKRKGGDKIRVSGEGLHTAYIGKPAHFQVQYLDDLDPSTIRAELRGPSGTIPVKLNLGENGGSASYMATETGPHELLIWCEGELIKECPRKVRVHPDISKVRFSGPNKPVPLGSTADMTVNSNGAGRGELAVEARSPGGRTMKCPVSEHNGNYTAKFQPDEVGEWHIGVTYDGSHIKGSPFSCNVFDPNAVKVSGLDVGVVGQDMDFAVDTSRAGQGEASVEIFYQGRNVPARIDQLGNGMYKVTFTPHGPGLYTIHVYFNGMEVRGSPFTIEIFDTSTVSASGEGLKLVPVQRPAFFAINTKGATSKDLQVSVAGPSGRTLPVQILEVRPGAYKAEYTPVEVGEHSIDIAFFDKAIRGSPFKCYAYDARMIRVGKIPNGWVGRPVEFEIDGSQAGSGNLEILVNGGRVVSHVKSLGNQRFLASFTPLDAMTHVVEMRFNGETVMGSPWNVQIWDPRNVTARDIPKHFQINRATGFDINASNVGPGDLKVEVKAPSMRIISSYTSETRTGVYRCEFTSNEIGSHSIEISYADTKITGSPFISKGFDASKIKISKVTNAFVGLPVQFQVDASQAGEGQLEISINNGRVPNKVDVLGGGKCLVTFTPTSAQPHYIDVKFNQEPVPGCPVQCTVFDTSRLSASGAGLQRVRVGVPATFTVNTAGAGEAELRVTIESPSRREVRSRVSTVSHVGYEVEWTASEVGVHMVSMEYAGQVVGQGPVPVKAYDPTKVKVGDLKPGFVGKPVTFTIDASEAGEGSVEIVVTDTQQRHVATRVEQLSTARYSISFVPQEASHHSIEVTFNQDTVPGSPFGVDVTDASKVQVVGEGLRVAQVRQAATFSVITKGAGSEVVEVAIDGPDGRKIPARVVDNGDQTYRVEYVAQVAGEHRIMVTYGGQKAGQSPYTAKAFDVSAIRVGEIPDGIVGKPVTFTVDASQAGTGNLEVAINNGRVQTTAESLGSNRYAITFTPRSTETHMIELKFNGITVPGSPFRCNIIDASRVVAMGDGLERVPVNKMAWFTVDPRGSGPAECEVTVTAPSGKKVPVRISGSHASTFRAEYTPTEVGDHLIEVTYAAQPITGSPFVCRVYDPDRVTVTQTKTGIVGKPVSFHVDASQAGAGNLEIVVNCNGKNVPNFVQAEGNAKFKVSFTPQEAMPHQIRVRFNNHVVPGTPYDCEIIDGSRCTASGDGLRLAPVNKPAYFIVDPRGAGAAELKITITAPSGKTVPVSVTGSAQSKFRAEYVPTEVGPHTITVYYAETPISGSPFTCNVYDASRIKVGPIGHGIVGRPVKFQVDASNAGEGKLDVNVTCNGQEVRADIAPVGRGRYEVTFVPREVATHFIDVQFNDTQVEGAPFRCEIIDGSRSTAEGDGLRRAMVGEVAWFEIDPRGPPIAEADAKITSPSGVRLPTQIRKTSRGTFRIEYTPQEVGPHKIACKYAETPLNGSPFVCEVYDPRNVRVEELKDGFVGKEYTFAVDASAAGQGEVEVDIEPVGGRPVKPTVTPVGAGFFEVTFTPRDAGVHGITVKFNSRVVPGSPFKMNVHDPSQFRVTGDGLKRACVGEVAWFEIETRGTVTGEMDIKITSPAGTRVATNITKSRNGLRVEYTPTEVGAHRISTKYAEVKLQGSPFTCDVYDPSKVKVRDITDGYVGKESVFRVDASQAGAGDVDVNIEISSRSIKPAIRPTGNGIYDVTFTPRDVGQHGITVKFVNKVVPGSPFKMNVLDPSQMKVTGDGLKWAWVGETAWFEIDPRGGNAEVGVKITSPTGQKVPCTITRSSRGVFRVEYVPAEAGAHNISCKYADTPLSGSPFTCQVFDVRKVKLSGVEDGIVGKESKFMVDASQAGAGGEVEIEVEGNGRSVKSTINDMGKGMYEVTYTPRDPGAHTINVKYAQRAVPECPVVVNVYDPSLVKVTGDGLKRACVGETAWFEIDPRGGTADASVKITSPSGTRVPVQMTKSARGIIRVEYVPTEIGPHRISCKYAGMAVTGSPFTCEVYDYKQVKVRDLHDGYVGKENMFRVEASGAGQGELEVDVEAGGRNVPCTMRPAGGHGNFEVTFTPRESGGHHIIVKFAGRAVPGSPFRINVHDASLIRVTGDGLRRARVGQKAWFNVEMREGTLDVRDLSIQVTAPNGSSVPVKLAQTGKGEVHAEYTPKVVGPHRIEVGFVGQTVAGSPFTCEVYDPSRVNVKDFPDVCYTGEPSNFEVTTRDAGKAELSVKIVGPSGREIPVELVDSYDGQKVRFTPIESGKHRLHIMYGGEDVPGSPFTFMVDEPGFPTASGDGLLWALADEPAVFRVDAKNLRGKLEVLVNGPNSTAKTTISPEKHGMYKVTYIAMEVGIFDIKITWNGKEIPGSPFHPKVFDPTKVRVVGGWPAHLDEKDRIKMRVGEEKKVTFDTSEAGPGKLSAEVRGPSGLIPVKVETVGKDRVKVSFTAIAEGHHDIHVWWSEQPIPHSPFPGWAEPALIPIDAGRVRLRGRGLTEAKVREEAEFIIDGADAGPGEPEVHISGIKADIPVTLQHLGSNVYKATYTAQHSGSYVLNVKWSGDLVRGCPYKLTVASGADASKVVVTGEIKSGMIGKDIKSMIDTRRAGPGELSVHCMGPHKEAFCELYDHRDGTYTLRIKPAEAGQHLLTIKYNGEHVPGSPFAIKIAGSPDPSKVRVYGPGVNHGVLASYQSRFLCETKGAGAGQLTVRVRGPKGAFRVEMQRESQKDRTILCKYDPTEPGDYRIEVKWSGEHVPGSPFNIWIFDTEDELNRFLRTGEIPRPSSPLGGPGYVHGMPEYTYGNANGVYVASPPPPAATSYSQWRRGSADI